MLPLPKLLTQVRKNSAAMAAVSIVIVQCTSILFLSGTRLNSLISDNAQTAAALLVTYSALDARKRFSEDGQRFWGVLALSFFLWSAVSILWTLQQNFYALSPLLSGIHISFFFTFLPLLFLALWESGLSLSLKLLDISQVILSALLLAAYFFWVPGFKEDYSMHAASFFVAMNLRNGVLIGAFFLQAFTAPTYILRGLFRDLSLVFIFYTLANGVSAIALIYLKVGDGSWFDLAWTLPFCWAAIVAATSNEAVHPVPISETLTKTQIACKSILNNILPLSIPLLIIGYTVKISMDRRYAIIALILTLVLFAIRSSVMQYDQFRTLQRLKLSDLRFKQMFEQHPLPMWLFDAQSLYFLEVNAAAMRKYGYSKEEFHNMKVLELRDVSNRDQLTELIPEIQHSKYFKDVKHISKSGQNMYMEIFAERVIDTDRDAILVVAVDTSDRALLEQQLQQSQKMEAVGRLAGGIAHDFNNILTVITGYSSLLADTLSLHQNESSMLAEINNASHRASGLTKQLLAFSRRQILQPEYIDLNQIVTQTINMVERVIGENILVRKKLSTPLSIISADPTQMDQVILNLAVNAKDAMPNGGELTVETRNVSTREIALYEDGMDPDIDYVLLKVSDTGTGIPENILPKIFEPFFTTKEVHKGTGLGLATVYGIVKQSAGHITVFSKHGTGTSFSLFFPAQKISPHVSSNKDE